jgi:hypothetical protein
MRRGQVVYHLKRKNYDDLSLSDLVVPRILVVVLVPRDESETTGSVKRTEATPP